MALLQVFKGDRVLLTVPLGDRPLTVGRGHEADIRIPDPGIARRQCRVEVLDGRVFVSDLATGRSAALDATDPFAIGDVRLAVTAGPDDAAPGEATITGGGTLGGGGGHTAGEDTTVYLGAAEPGARTSLEVESPRGVRACSARLDRLVDDLGHLYDDFARATARDTRLRPLMDRLLALTCEAEALVGD